MLGTFLDKVSGLLDRRFLLVWWFPTIMAGAAALLLGVSPYGLASVLQWWGAWDGVMQSWLAMGGLLGVTLLAYLLQAFTRPLVQFYEGYWPPELREWYNGFTQLTERWQGWREERTQAALAGDLVRYADLQDRLHHEYPPRPERLLPTRLGNVLRSAEDYPVTVYGMDAVFWWPRLWPLLPEGVKKEVRDSLSPVLALLNLTTLLALVAVGGPLYLALHRQWWLGLGVLALGPMLVVFSYLGAVAQARSYGQGIRAAVDLNRFELLKALHQPLPTTPQAERELWGRLADWLYNQDRGAAQALSYEHPKK